MKKPTVSVIIPTYNRAHLIGRAIQSVLNQTYPDFELIIVDDASTDHTENVIKEFLQKDKRISYLKHDKNKGGSAARNTGIKTSKGEYIAFLDSDDEWLQGKLEKQTRFFLDKSIDVALVYTGSLKINGNLEKISTKIIHKKKGWIFKDLLLKYCIGPTSSIMIRQKCLKDVGLFDEDLPSCHDWDLWLRISKKYKIDCLEEPLVKYYINEMSITANEDVKILGRKKIIENFKNDLNENNRILAQHYFEIGNIYCHYLDINDGKKYFFKAIYTYPFNIKYIIYFISSLFNKKVYLVLAKIKRSFNKDKEKY
jgi:glycosyltransferase involved in cell wall biosynthesis